MSKEIPENRILLVSKLKRALQSFLTGVLEIDDCEDNSSLNVCLIQLQTNWKEVTNLPILVEDILAIQALTRLLGFVEDISWTANSVKEFINAAITIAGRFQKSGVHFLLATSFTLYLRECQNIERRLKQEITYTPQVENETEIYIAGAAFSATMEYLISICANLPTIYKSLETDPQISSSTLKPVSQNSKDKSNGSNASERLNENDGAVSHSLPSLNEFSLYENKVANWLDGINPNEDPFKLNTTKPQSFPNEDFIDELSVLYKKVSNMFTGFEGVRNENVRKLELTHPSIQLLYNTILELLPESVPLGTPKPNSNTVYVLGDLTPKCILEYCTQEDKRETLVRANNSLSEVLFLINCKILR